MLLINASAKSSKINGIGLFANQDVSKGTQIWKFNQRSDLVFGMTKNITKPCGH